MTADAQLLATLRALFPADIAIAAGARCPAEAVLLPEEQHSTHSMVAKRRREFLHGRHRAREALGQLGQSPIAIPKHADRSPQWPPGYIGSITHTAELAAAVAASATRYAGIGIDIESAEALDEATRKMILRPEENAADGAAAKLRFSIKEAIYKCIYPRVQTYVDFREMEVRLQPEQATYTAVPHSSKFAPELIAGLTGRFVITDTHVASSAWLPI